MPEVNANYIGNKSSLTAGKIASSFSLRVEEDGGIVESEDCLISRINELKSAGLWNKASAVWLPHGYKESKLYAVKGGAGCDLGFTRAGTRYRKASSLVEQVPYNLLSRSEEFDNAAWTKSSCTVSTNAIIAPDGKSTADKIIEDATPAVSHFVHQSITKTTASVTYTYSVYAKKGERDWLRIQLDDSAGNAIQVWFNLDAGVVGSNSSGGTGFSFVNKDIIDENDGWYRCIVTITTNSAATLRIPLCIQGSDLELFYSGDGNSGIYLWGAQLVQGSEARDYFTATGRFNVPALDYTGSTCPALSLEPARTNLLLRSEEFDNTSWAKNFTTIVANNITGPDGISTADKVLETVDNQHHYIAQSYNKAASSQPASITFFFKYLGRQWVYIQATDGVSNTVNQWFDIQNGVVGTTSQVGTTYTKLAASITDFGNGWYRCEFNIQVNNTQSSVSTSFRTAAGDGNSAGFTGDITKGYYGFGAQVENNVTYATSYIPTTTGTVSRIADSISALLPKGTNQILQSQTFDNAAWTKDTGDTIVANDATAPDNTATADKYVEGTSSHQHRMFQAVAVTAGLTYTFSVYAKERTGSAKRYLAIFTSGVGFGSPGSPGSAIFDLATGTKVHDNGGTVASGIEPATNGYYRIWVTDNATITSTSSFFLAISDVTTTVPTRTGDGVSGFHIWGAQVEYGDEATTYVATTTAPKHNGTVIGQTQGTFYFDGYVPANSVTKEISLTGGSSSDRITISFLSSNVIRGHIATESTTQFNISNAGFVSGTRYRIVITYTNNYAALTVNGVKIGEDLLVTVPTCNQIEFNDGDATSPIYGDIVSICILPTALTDAEAIAATTP